MKRILYLTIFTITAALPIAVFGQSTLELNCTQKLRTARATYEQGRLHELPSLLESCLVSGFTDAEKVEGYRLLVLTYIYLEEPEKADFAMASLLKHEHFFETNPAVDPIEFQNLHDKFRWWQICRVGVKFGFLTNHVRVAEAHPVWTASAGKGDYASKVGIQVGLFYEKDFKNKLKQFTLAPEVMFASYSYTYTNDALLLSDEPNDKSFNALHTISQSRLQTNVMLQYRLDKSTGLADNLIPYVALGPSVNFLMGSDFDGSINVGESVTGTTIDTKERYQPITFSVIASAGVKLRLGEFYITADVRYQHGLQNLVNTKKNPFDWQGGTSVDLADYGYADNDFRLSQTSFNLGFIYPIFSAKKLIK